MDISTPQPAGGPDALTIASFVIALLGFTIALIALVWSILSWRLTGSVVRVSLSFGMPIGMDGNLGPDMVGVTASNVGRIAVSVEGAAIAFLDNSKAWWGLGGGGGPGPSLSHTLEPGHSATWHFLREGLRNAALERGFTSGRGFVSLGTGRTVTSRKSMKL